MSNEQQIIFVDESGNLALPNEDIKSYYSICAIFIDESRLEDFKTKARDIVQRNAGIGELKSSNIGNNLRRREKILKDISDADFSFYCLVIDKQRIFKDSGLKYKTVSYKYLHRMFYERIKRSFFYMNLISDPYGRSDFMISFEKYIQSNGNLFEEIQFVPSPEEPLLQISDVIAGSIRRVYLGDDPISNLELIGYPSIPIEEWPPNFTKYSEYEAGPDDDKLNKIIRELALNSAREFVEFNIDNSDLDLRSQAEAVRYLLYKFNEDPQQFIHRYKIEEYLKSINITTNSRTILSKLRDNNIIICSTDQGVKIPFTTKDIYLWVQRTSSQVVPYIKRVNQVRTDLLIKSSNKYDIVNADDFPELSQFMSR